MDVVFSSRTKKKKPFAWMEMQPHGMLWGNKCEYDKLGHRFRRLPQNFRQPKALPY